MIGVIRKQGVSNIPLFQNLMSYSLSKYRITQRLISFIPKAQFKINTICLKDRVFPTTQWTRSVISILPILSSQSYSNSKENYPYWHLMSAAVVFAPISLDESEKHPKPLSKGELIELCDNLGYGSPRKMDNVDGYVFRDIEYTEKCFQKAVDALRNNTKYKESVYRNIDLISRLTDPSGKTILHIMIEEGKAEQVKELIQNGFEYRYCDSEGNNGLHIATLCGHTHLIPFLSNYFPMEDTNNLGQTPLHIAAERGNLDLVKQLFKNGSDFKTPWISPDGISYPLLALAIKSGDIPTIDFIAEKDLGRLSSPLGSQGTIFHLAISQGKKDPAVLFKHLLTKYPHQTTPLLKEADERDRTPLHLAIFEGLGAVVAYLVKGQQIDINQTSQNDSLTGVHWAAMNEQVEMIKLLYYLGADLQRSDAKGNTPLAYLNDRTSNKAHLCRIQLKKLSQQKLITRNLPQDYREELPENLVFEGGGAKGLAYVGAIKAAEDLRLLEDISRVSGTSAGSIAAGFVAVGCNSDELLNELSKDFSSFLDPVDQLSADLLSSQNPKSAPQSMAILWAIVKEYWNGSGSIVNPIGRVKSLYNHLVGMKGLCKGEKLEQWIEQIIAVKTGIPNCTFKELHDKMQKEPNKYKDLFVHTIALQENGQPKLLRCSFEDPVLQHVVISSAIRASASIPGVFEPAILKQKPPHDNVHERRDLGRCVDGGLLINLPIDDFDDNCYQADRDRRGKTINRRTLGFKLQSSENEATDLSSSLSFAKAIFMTFYNAQEILLKQSIYDQERIISIPVNITTLDLKLDDKQKAEVVEAGRKAVGQFLAEPTAI